MWQCQAQKIMQLQRGCHGDNVQSYTYKAWFQFIYGPLKAGSPEYRKGLNLVNLKVLELGQFKRKRMKLYHLICYSINNVSLNMSFRTCWWHENLAFVFFSIKKSVFWLQTTSVRLCVNRNIFLTITIHLRLTVYALIIGPLEQNTLYIASSM